MYVDLIEVVSCVVSASGITMLALCQGTLQMKSYMSVEGISSVLKLSNFNCSELAPQFPFMQGGAPIHCFVEDMQLHQDANLLETCTALPTLASLLLSLLMNSLCSCKAAIIAVGAPRNEHLVCFPRDLPCTMHVPGVEVSVL